MKFANIFNKNFTVDFDLKIICKNQKFIDEMKNKSVILNKFNNFEQLRWRRKWVVNESTIEDLLSSKSKRD